MRLPAEAVPEVAPRGPDRPKQAGGLRALWARALEQAPGRLKRLTRSLGAEARAAALSRIPLPLYELWRMQSFDPFVPRANTVSYRTSGKHFLILAELPMTDSGGGQRPAQLALELLHRAHRVTYVYRFASRDYSRRRRTVAHENLTHVRFDEFSARRFSLERASRERIIALCEAPLPEYRACLRYLRARGAQTVYDCIDPWDSPFGGRWYARSAENGLLEEVDLVTAASRGLKDELETRSWLDVALVPNAVNARLFVRGRTWERPADLPRASPVFLYVGAMWRRWFAWDWVRTLARAHPEAAVVLVGDDRGRCRQPPPNLHCLGLRPQAEVAAYVAHADVCLVPFLPDRTPVSVSPLKAFEYVALGKPVVASPLPELADVPGVRLASNAAEFVERVGDAVGKGPSEEEIARFVAEHSWKARVRQLSKLLGV